MAHNAGSALLGLINDILDFSKIEAKMLTLEKTEFSVRENLEGVMEIMSGAAEAKGIRLVGVTRRDIPLRAVGDPLRLRQILMNLVNNALKFTEKGHVSVHVSRRNMQRGREVLLFEAVDTGVGIPKGRQATLFDAFVQADSSTTRKFGGTGLGLSICKQLVELMDGELGVESEVGRGSRFWFTVALDLASTPSSDTRIKHRIAARDHRIIVLSDCDLIRRQVREHLLCIGYEADAVYTQEGECPSLDDLPARFLADPERLLVLCDPHGQSEPIREFEQRLVAGPGARPRICELIPLLGLNEKSELPAAVEGRLTVPIQFRSLLDWIDHLPDPDDPAKPQPKSQQGSVSQPEPLSQPQQEPTPEKGGNPKVEQPAAASEAPKPDSGETSCMVLIAEDNIFNQQVAATVLKKAGFATHIVGDGQEAIDFLLTERADIVLMDCHMPVMDGWEASRQIRAMESRGELAAGCPSHIPIIAATARVVDGSQDECIEAGMDGFVAKPIALKQLLETIGNVLPPDVAASVPGLAPQGEP